MKDTGYISNRWVLGNLEPLADFMYATGVSTVDIAGKIGRSRQAVRMALSKDDMKVSMMEKIFNAYGCVIDIRLASDSEGSTTIEEDVKSSAMIAGGINTRLSFIQEEMRRQGLVARTLAEKMAADGHFHSPQTVNLWFNTGDCLMSQLRQMAGALGSQLEFRIRRSS